MIRIASAVSLITIMIWAGGCAGTHRVVSSAENEQVVQEFTICSYNMLHGWPNFTYLRARLGLLAEELKSVGPDIVCLQEVPVVRGLKINAAAIQTDQAVAFRDVAGPLNASSTAAAARM